MQKKLSRLVWIAALLVVMIALVLPTAAVDAPKVTVQPDVASLGESGGTVTYTVTLVGEVSGVESIGFTMTVPAGLTYDSATFEVEALEKSFTSSSGQFLVLGFNAADDVPTALDVTGSQVIGKVSFTATSAVSSTKVTLADEVGNSYFMNGDTMVPITLEALDAPAEVKKVSIGGTVTSWVKTDGAKIALYPSSMDDADIKTDMEKVLPENAVANTTPYHDITVDNTSWHRGTFEFTDVPAGEYKLAVMDGANRLAIVSVSAQDNVTGVDVYLKKTSDFNPNNIYIDTMRVTDTEIEIFEPDGLKAIDARYLLITDAEYWDKDLADKGDNQAWLKAQDGWTDTPVFRNLPQGTAYCVFVYAKGDEMTEDSNIVFVCDATTKIPATVTINNTDVAYTGNAVVADYTYNGNATPTVTWYADVDGKKAETALAGAPTNVGTYWVVVSAKATNEYTPASGEKKFTITPATVSEIVVTLDGEFTKPVTGEQFPAVPTVSVETLGVTVGRSDYSTTLMNAQLTHKVVKGSGDYFAVIWLNLDSTNCNFDGLNTLKLGGEPITKSDFGANAYNKWYWKRQDNAVTVFCLFDPTDPATATGITLTPASLDETVQLSLDTDWRTALAEAGVTAKVTFNDDTTADLTDENLTITGWTKESDTLTISYPRTGTDALTATLTLTNPIKGKTIEAKDFNFTEPDWTFKGEYSYYDVKDTVTLPEGVDEDQTSLLAYKVTESEEPEGDSLLSDAGEYNLYVREIVNEDGSIYEDYQAATGSNGILLGTITIKKAQNCFDFVTSAIYGEKPQLKSICNCETCQAGNITVTYGATKESEFTPWSDETPLDAGQRYIKVIWAECENCVAGSQEGKFTVHPKDLTDLATITINDPDSIIYSGEPLTPAVTVKFGEKELVEGEDEDYTVEYSNNINAVYGDAGYPTVTVTFTGNYSGTASEEFTIQQFTPVWAMDDQIQTVVYGVGDFIEPILVGPKGEVLTCTLTYTWDVDGIDSSSNTKDGTYEDLKAVLAAAKVGGFGPSDRESYDNMREYALTKVTASKISAVNGNPNLNYGDGTFEYRFAVNIQKIKFTTDDALTINPAATYGDDWSDIITINPSLTASLNGEPVDGKFKLVQTGKPNAGEVDYEIIFDSDNYGRVSVLKNKVTVAPKPLTAGDFEYDAGDKSKTYDGTTTATGVTVKVKDNALVNASDVVTVTTQTAVYNDANVAGAKVITVTPTAVNNPNYTVADGAQVTINGASITPKSVTVKIANATRKYGENEPTFGGAVNTETPMVSGETIDDLGLSYTTTATTTSDVGEYAINGTAANGNYKVTFVPGKLTIGKAPAPTGTYAHEYKVRYNDTSRHTVSPEDFGLPNGVKEANIYSKGEAEGDTNILLNSPTSFELRENLTANDVGKSISWKITISSKNHANFDATVTVTVVAKSDAGVTLDNEDVSTGYGNVPFTLTATVGNPGENGKLTWSSDNSAVATVDQGGKVTIVGVGSAQITATYESDTTAGSADCIIVVNKKMICRDELVVSGSLTKTYDGTTTSSITLKVKDGVPVSGDTVNVIGAAAYNSANVADATKITVSSLTLDNENYQLEVSSIELTDGVAITPATLTAEGTAETTAPYGAQISSITLPTLTAKWNGTTVPGAWAWVESGALDVNAGGTKTLTARFTPESSNYKALDVPTTVTVTKADYTGTTALSTSVWSNKAGEYRYPLDALQGIVGATVGSISVSDPDTVLNGTPSMDGTAVVIKVNAVEAGKSATITIPITSATNYNDFEYTLEVNVSDKTDAGVDITLYPFSRTYGDKPFTPTVKIDHPGENGKLRWESTNPAVLTVDENGKVTVVGVGKAYIKVYYESDTTIGSDTTLDIDVLAKSLTVTAPTITTVKDADLPDLTQYAPTVKGLVNSDTATGFTLAYNGTPDMTTAGEYAITVSGGTIINANCYTVTYVPGKLSISMTYAVTVTATDGGTASASAAVPVVAGTPITLTAAPADGYTFVRWEAVAPTTLTITGNGFTMPAEAVTVKAVFARTAPTIEVETVKPSGGETEDGEISGVNDTMEYSADGGVTWIAVATGETTICGLKPGTYLLRYRAIGSAEPSEPIEITLEQKPASTGFNFYPIVFRLYFETNGGKEIAPQLRMLSNRVDFTKITTTREGYIFTGWYADPALTVPLTEIRMRGNRTVYAGWEEIEPVEPEVPETPEVEVPEEPEVETPEVEPIVNPFTDVAEADWFYADVLFAVDNALMTGATETTFAPDATVTRGDFIRMLWLIEGCPKVDFAADLWDVPGDADYREAIEWAVLQGLLSHNEGIINPTATLTRDQMTTIVYRYATAKQIAGEATGTLDAFKDTDKLGDWAKDAMVWATANGILHLRSADLLDPTEPATRAELAAILHGMMTPAGELEA